jgi:hypothetical protein
LLLALILTNSKQQGQRNDLFLDYFIVHRDTVRQVERAVCVIGVLSLKSTTNAFDARFSNSMFAGALIVLECCMLGGARCLMHNAIVHRLTADASFGLFHPVREAHPFADNDRMDIVLRAGPREQLLDIAVTCPFRQTHGALAKAAEAPGGWATSYEAVKRTSYGAKCNALQDLIPVVFDTFGAAGVSARPVLSRIACGFSKRLGDRSGRLIFFTRLNTLIVSRTAAIVAHEV